MEINLIAMKLAVVGATGLVGQEVLKVLGERHLDIDELIPVASKRSAGRLLNFNGVENKVVDIDQALELKPDAAIFSAGGDISLKYAPLFAAVGCTVVDNSSAWRMNPKHKLVVPEINGNQLTRDDKIIANPNCSTIQMVLVLAPLHAKYGLKRVVVSTYQSVTGTGKAAVDQLMAERAGQEGGKVYPHRIDMNVIPHIDVFQENGYTKEEMKMINETRKILGVEDLALTATTVRLPVVGGHSESVNIEMKQNFDLKDIYSILNEAEGVEIVDNPANNEYPMPLDAQGRDEVFVGRIRRDESQINSINLWIVADNLRKGAATNAVQIVELLQAKNLIG